MVLLEPALKQKVSSPGSHLVPGRVMVLPKPALQQRVSSPGSHLVPGRVMVLPEPVLQGEEGYLSWFSPGSW